MTDSRDKKSWIKKQLEIEMFLTLSELRSDNNRLYSRGVITDGDKAKEPFSWSVSAGMLRYRLGSLVRVLRRIAKSFLTGQKNESQAEMGVSEQLYSDNTHAERKKNILFLGPLGYREGVWDTRVSYIFPDLFEPLLEKANIFMLTGPVPQFAKPGIRKLKNKYGIRFKTVPRGRNGRNQYEHWICHTTEYASRINADIVTNIFSPVLFSYVAANVAQTLNIRSVARVAGDEINTRISLGLYESGSDQHAYDLRKEMFGFNYVDTVLTMSPLEMARVRDLCLDESKVNVAMRGIDLKVFSPPDKKKAGTVKKYLFVGRKSLEKGYDLIEEAAKLVEKQVPELEFVFAGTFDVHKKGNRNYVGFVHSDDLPELYRGVDALVLCSRSEGFPQVVMEAMSVGLPCILSRPLFDGLFEDMNEVILSDLEPAVLAEHIVMLHKDNELAIKLSRNAREYAMQHFDRSLWRDMYRDLLIDAPSIGGDHVM